MISANCETIINKNMNKIIYKIPNIWKFEYIYLME